MKKRYLVGLACGVMILGMAGAAQATTIEIPMELNEWAQTYGHGLIEQTSEGIKLNTEGYRTGNTIESNQTIDLSNTDVYIKWKVDGGGSYMGAWPSIVNTSHTYGAYPAIGMTTAWSFMGSVVLPENTWLFTHFDFNPDKTWTANTSTNNYDNLGGMTFANNSNSWTPPDQTGIINVSLGDNYAGSAVWLVLGEAKYDTAPVPEPATMLLFGSGLAGLVGARRKKKK